jgi:hypothetical protein
MRGQVNTPRKQPTTKTMFVDVLRTVGHSSVWNCTIEELDLSELRIRFAKKEKTESTPVVKNIPPSSCLDSTRERNVGIVLKCLRLQPNEICEAIEEMDVDALSEEAVAALLSIFPTADEQRKVSVASTNQKQSVCCQFFEMCARNPQLEQQLRCWLSMIRFGGSFQDLLSRVEDVRRACRAAVDSHGLTRLLTLLLAFCNELNKDLPSLQNARGFRVTDLPKFKTMTYSSFNASCENSMKNNLLHLAVSNLSEENHVSVTSLKNILQNACKVDLGCLHDELEELHSHVAFVRNVAAESTCSRHTQFLNSASSCLQRLTIAQQEMNDSIATFSQYFDLKEGEWSESLSALTQFAIDVVKCS